MCSVLVLFELDWRRVRGGADLLLGKLQFGLEHGCLLVHLRDVPFGLLKELLVAQGCFLRTGGRPRGERLLPLRLLTLALLLVLVALFRVIYVLAVNVHAASVCDQGRFLIVDGV